MTCSNRFCNKGWVHCYTIPSYKCPTCNADKTPSRTIKMQTLIEWRKENVPAEDMKYKEAAIDQFNFVANNVASLFAKTAEEYRECVKVVGWHRSKSIVLPVYYIDCDGIELWFRNNFHNWNVSVNSSVSLEDVDWLHTFSDDNYGYCFCEGMEQWKYRTFATDPQRFTVDITSRYDFYCFLRILREIYRG